MSDLRDESGETSADWADRLQLYDAGEFDALQRVKTNTLQKQQQQQQQQLEKLQSARHDSGADDDVDDEEEELAEQEIAPVPRAEHQQRPAEHAFASEHRVPPALQQARVERLDEKTLDASPLTARVRARLRQADGTMGRPSETMCALLVRQVSPSLLSKLHTHANPPCAVLFAYFDACPYSRAAEDALVSLAERMHRRNLSLRREDGRGGGGGGSDFCIMMYDIRAKGNRTFASDRLRASPVPKLYTVVPESRAIVPWSGKPLGEVQPSASGWTRTLPENALIDALSAM